MPTNDYIPPIILGENPKQNSKPVDTKEWERKADYIINLLRDVTRLGFDLTGIRLITLIPGSWKKRVLGSYVFPHPEINLRCSLKIGDPRQVHTMGWVLLHELGHHYTIMEVWQKYYYTDKRPISKEEEAANKWANEIAEKIMANAPAPRSFRDLRTLTIKEVVLEELDRTNGRASYETLLQLAQACRPHTKFNKQHYYYYRKIWRDRQKQERR